MESRDDEGKDDGSGMVNSSSVGGSGTSLSNRKRASEKRRREEVHTRFKDLEELLTQVRGEEVIKGRKWDKERIVFTATEFIREQKARMNSIQTEVKQIETEVDDLRNEKLELRADKSYLKDELAKLREENKRLKKDNITLWQSMRKEQNHWTQPVPPLRAPEPIAMYEVATPDNQPNLDDNPETEAMADDHLANIDLDPPHLNLPLDIDQDELDSQSPQQFYLQSQQNTAAPTTSEQETEYPWP